jgi:3-keto-disaccharide hydrolase
MTAHVVRRSALTVALAATSVLALAQAAKDWPVHDESRPRPVVVAPGTFSSPEEPGRPPSDAVVLFGGKDLSAWKSSKDGGPAPWKVDNGYFEVGRKTGSIETKEAFGDCQLHVEWRAPAPPRGTGQDRGNSGIYLMGRYEVQVLDSYQSETYADGQAAALYGQYPPLVNACRPPGEWQVYDIVFEAPRFDAQGKLLRKARATVFHNGVVVQNATEFMGPTTHKARPPYVAHPDRLPLSLQDHDHPVRYRNIWIRELKERP